MRCVIPVLLLVLVSLASDAVEKKPVFVKATCNGKISSAVLSHLEEEIRRSDNYRLIPSLDDGGRMDEVLTIQLSCKERENVTAVATVYGKAKCFGPKCHGAFDVPSLRADFCDSDVTECARMLFRAFERYMANPAKTQLILERSVEK